MGSLISVDRDLTQLEELLSAPVSLFKPSKVSMTHSHHLKLWRFCEDPQNSESILTQAVSLTEPQVFKNKECYLVLLIYRRDSHLKFNGYPHTIWGMLESLTNLTPRGLENIFTSDDLACLDTFLLSRREQEENEVHYMLFVWNGKIAGALLKAFALTKGFELDHQLVKGKMPILQSLFSGVSVKSKTVQQSPVISLESAFQYDTNTNKKPDCPVYLLQWLWPENPAPSPNSKPLFPKFKEMFLSSSDTPTYLKLAEDKFVPKLSIAVKEKIDLKPKLTSLSLSGLKTREEERVQLQNLNKNELDLLDDNFDVRDTNRKEMKLKYYSEIASELDPGLYVGSDIVARDKDKLKSQGITHIINCAANVCKNYFPNDFKYTHYFLKDARTESIECLFYECIEFISNAIISGGKVFVHCMQGVSRSVTVCLAYIIFTRQKPFEQVFSEAKNLRGICSPNTGFQVQLIWWYKRLFEEYESLPVSPRVFAIGSHQKEQPHTIVARILTQPLYFGPEYLTLDSRGVFIVQCPSNCYIWIGSAIPVPNKDIYMNAAYKHYNYLSTYENAQNLVEINEGREPEVFWALWKDARKGSGNNDLWNSWYPDLSSAIDEEPQELQQDHEEEEIQNKPKLYIYPELTGIGVFEDEELVDEAFLCLCTPDKCYKWKGFEANLTEKQEIDYIKNATQNYFGFVVLDVINEEPGNESYDFLNYF
jgi:Dual specificity phosphatase, catalytic domain